MNNAIKSFKHNAKTLQEIIVQHKKIMSLIFLFLLGSVSLSGMEINKEGNGGNHDTFEFTVFCNNTEQQFTANLYNNYNTLTFTPQEFDLDIFNNGSNMIERKYLNPLSSNPTNNKLTFTVGQPDAQGFIPTFSLFSAANCFIRFEKRSPGNITTLDPTLYGTKQEITKPEGLTIFHLFKTAFAQADELREEKLSELEN